MFVGIHKQSSQNTEMHKLLLAAFFILSLSLQSKLLAQAIVPVSSIQEAMKMENIQDSYLQMNEYFRSKPLEKSAKPFVFPQKDNVALPENFIIDGTTFELTKYIDSSDTQGLLVIQNDTIIYENYWKGQQANSKHISWSMAKSYISALIGIAIEEGHIKSIQEPIDNYLPELKESGYEGVKIRHILEMATGIGFDETYSDPNSDINRWWMSFIQGESQDAFAATLKRTQKPGKVNQYISINTHVLGMLLTKATGKSITEYMQEKLWTPLGNESDAYWLSDKYGMEMALGGLNATLKDYAKLGQLFLQNGAWQGEQIVPKKWVKKSTKSGKPYLKAKSKNALGYGYQWWIPYSKDGEFMAVGVFNQYIYVNPSTNTVIVKNSANRNYYDGSNPYRSSIVHLELFRQIANSFSD
ncbi:MAG: serine hydrolase [Bacteroidota bacterium]